MLQIARFSNSKFFGMVENAGSGYRIRIPDTDTVYSQIWVRVKRGTDESVNSGRTDGRTDGRTGGRTDERVKHRMRG